jgi:predicted flap endonuclease-1-like 5' DNA nuclease
MKKLNPFAGEEKGRSWFWWGINLGILTAIALWWWLQKNKLKGEIKAEIKVEPIVLPEDEPEAAVNESETEKTDDLRVVEGIGPRSAEVLEAAGVKTYTQLSEMDPDAIQAILREANVRVPYPETWPEQAALAAAGNWDALEELQETLQAGRRV